MSGQESRPSRFGNLLALRQEKDQRGAAEDRSESLVAPATHTDDPEPAAGRPVGTLEPTEPSPSRSTPRTERDGAVAPVSSAGPAAKPGRSDTAPVARGSSGRGRERTRSQLQVSGAKRPQSIAVYDVNWRWLRDQASGTEFDEGYARASQIAAEILAAAEETGLDVRAARTLEEVRELALRHFGHAQ